MLQFNRVCCCFLNKKAILPLLTSTPYPLRGVFVEVAQGFGDFSIFDEPQV